MVRTVLAILFSERDIHENGVTLLADTLVAVGMTDENGRRQEAPQETQQQPSGVPSDSLLQDRWDN